jgi:prolyl-tRNA synthetase
MIVPAQMENDRILEHAEVIHAALATKGVRIKIDKRSGYSMGWKLNDAELQGMPLTMVIGEREIESAQLSLNVRYSKSKQQVAYAEYETVIPELLQKIQSEMFAAAKARRDQLTFEVTSYDQFKEIMNTSRGFLKAFWCEDPACEKAIKDETKASTRCLPFTDLKGNVAQEQGICIKCGKPATHRWLFAQSY